MLRSVASVVVAMLVLANAVADESRDNFLNFKGVDSVSWTETGHAITSGQKYDGVTSKGNAIDVKAGRHGSKSPATNFEEGVDFDKHMMGLSAHAAKPQELNFATFGTLSLSFPSGVQKSC